MCCILGSIKILSKLIDWCKMYAPKLLWRLLCDVNKSTGNTKIMQCVLPYPNIQGEPCCPQSKTKDFLHMC